MGLGVFLVIDETKVSGRCAGDPRVAAARLDTRQKRESAGFRRAAGEWPVSARWLAGWLAGPLMARLGDRMTREQSLLRNEKDQEAVGESEMGVHTD